MTCLYPSIKTISISIILHKIFGFLSKEREEKREREEARKHSQETKQSSVSNSDMTQIFK